MRRIVALCVGIALAFSFGLGACKKKEEQPVPKAGLQMTPAAPGAGPAPVPGTDPAQMPAGHGTAPAGPKPELKVVVPDSVKGKWSAVKIVVEDKGAKKSQEYTVNLNSELKVPNSNLKIAVGDFLPDFKMDAGTVTSSSNTPNNPSVNVKVFEGDKEVFKGWLYSKFPTIHPFEHPKYGITLKEGIKKG